MEIVDVVGINASEPELVEDGEDVAEGTNRQEGKRVGGVTEIDSSCGAENAAWTLKRGIRVRSSRWATKRSSGYGFLERRNREGGSSLVERRARAPRWRADEIGKRSPPGHSFSGTDANLLRDESNVERFVVMH
jgi:hypothetical protein